MKKVSFFICLFFFCFANITVAQSIAVSGRVIDADNSEPIANAYIYEQGSVNTAITNTEGVFSIKLSSHNSILTVHSLGYIKQNVQLDKSSKTITIKLKKTDYELVEVVVKSGKLTEHFPGNSLSSSNITEKNIRNAIAVNIPDLLIRKPGVSMVGQAYHAAPSVRGLARKRVSVLLDGEKISSPRNVGAPGTFISPAEIKQIDILKGPYSTLYGSDAIGGVINIISKDYENPFYFESIGGRVDAAFRSVNNAYNLNASLNGKTGKKLQYRINVGYRNADSYKTPDKTHVMNTFFNEKHAGIKLAYQIKPKHKLQLKSYYSKGGEIGKPAYDTLTNAIHIPDNHFIAGVKYVFENKGSLLEKTEVKLSRHQHDLGVKIIKHKEEAASEEDKLINNKKDLSNTDYTCQVNFHLKPSKKLNIISGFDGYFSQNINISEHKVIRNYWSKLFIKEVQDTLLHNAGQNSYGIFSQANLLLSKKWFINGGIRWNLVKTKPENGLKNKTHPALSGNMGVVYFPSPNFKLKLNAGSAFRMPDVKELYLTTNTPGGLNIANPDLVPEHSKNIDFSALYNNKNTFLEAAVFYNQIDNMILLDWDNTSANRTGTFKNIGKGVIYGGELSYNQKIGRNIILNSNLTQIFGYDKTAQDELMDIPPLTVNLGIKYNLKKKAYFKLSGRYSAKQTKIAEDDIPNDAFFTLDFSSNVRILANLNLNFSVTNILNQSYREHYNFGWMKAPGRSFNLGLHFNF